MITDDVLLAAPNRPYSSGCMPSRDKYQHELAELHGKLDAIQKDIKDNLRGEYIPQAQLYIDKIYTHVRAFILKVKGTNSTFPEKVAVKSLLRFSRTSDMKSSVSFENLCKGTYKKEGKKDSPKDQQKFDGFWGRLGVVGQEMMFIFAYETGKFVQDKRSVLQDQAAAQRQPVASAPPAQGPYGHSVSGYPTATVSPPPVRDERQANTGPAQPAPQPTSLYPAVDMSMVSDASLAGYSGFQHRPVRVAVASSATHSATADVGSKPADEPVTSETKDVSPHKKRMAEKREEAAASEKAADDTFQADLTKLGQESTELHYDLTADTKAAEQSATNDLAITAKLLLEAHRREQDLAKLKAASAHALNSQGQRHKAANHAVKVMEPSSQPE